MNASQPRNPAIRRRRMLVFIAISVALYVTAFVLLRTYIPDCFAGTLSDDPVQCYVWERAHNEGIINVEAVYEVGEVLYFQLSQADFVTEEQVQSMLDLGKRFTITGDLDVAYRPPLDCPLIESARLSDCALANTFRSTGVLFWSNTGASVSFRPGGESARRDIGGWASHRQVWPQQTSGQARSTAPGSFDVSRLDVSNFPELECISPYSNITCMMWKRHPNLRIAGWRGTDTNWQMRYVQLAIPDGHPAALETARQELIDTYDFNDGALLTVIPAKYDFQELWMWSEVLNRFSVSPSNTLGIVGARVTTNVAVAGYVYPSVGMQRSPSLNHPLTRETIRIWAIDPQSVADALPELLPQLGIPTDAVGVIAPTDLATTERGGTLDVGWEADGLRITSWLGLDSRSPVLAWIVPAGTVAVVLALAGFVVVWLRHRRANRADAAPIPNVDAMG